MNIPMWKATYLDPISARLFHGAGNHGPIVLMYHSIAPGGGTPEWPWSISYHQFIAQLDLLQNEGWTTCCVRDLQYPTALSGPTVVITFDDGFADNYLAFDALIKRDMCATWFITSNMVGRSSVWTNPSRLMLNKEQLREMAAEGMEIGAHSRNHCRLTQLSDNQIQDEVYGSKKDLARIIGAEIKSFAYPYGDLDGRVVESVKNAGFYFACGTDAGWAFTDSNPLLIRRLSILNKDSISVFARKLALGSNNVNWRKVRLYAYERARTRFLTRK